MRLAIAGMGPHGKRMWKVAREIPGFEVVAVADRNPAAFEEINLNGTKTYSDALQLLENQQIDFFIITTNGPSHYLLAIEAMRQGVKRILVSKPLACTLNEANEMVRVAQENKVRLAVDHGLRHDGTYNWLREKIRSGEWGALRSVYVMRNGIGLGCLGVHSFDLVNSLVDSPVQNVTGWVDAPVRENPRGKEFIDPGGLVIIRYQNGVKGIVSQIEDGSGPMSVEINLTDARVQINEKFGKMEVVTKDNTQVAKPGKPVPLVRLENPNGAVSHDIFELMKSVLLEVAGDAPLKCAAVIGRQSFEMLLAAYLSHEYGNVPVSLPVSDEKAWGRFLPVT